MNMLKSAVAAVVATGICLLGFASDAIPQTNTASNVGVDIKRAMRAKLKARLQKDRELYGVEGLRKIEMAYRAYAKSKDVDNKNL